MQEIAKRAGETKRCVACTAAKLVIVAILGAGLSGCMGLGLGSDADMGLTTASTPATKPAAPVSDEATVRNAATSADIGKLKGQPLPWANTDTGSAGVITSIVEDHGDQLVCRDFTTISHSFQGVAKFRGKACLTAGNWQLVSFQKLD